MFMSPDQTFFITMATLNLVKERDSDKVNRAELGLLLCHELSHHLLDHTVIRLMTCFLNKHIIQGSWFFNLQKGNNNVISEVYDPVREDFKRITNL